MFTEAIISARKPKSLAIVLPLALKASAAPTATANSAPTTITEEIAFVTDISGVCSAGVTLHTT